MLYRKWVFGDEKKFAKKMAPSPNWEKICRICTNEDLDSILIFSEEGKKLFLDAKIKKYLYITILTDDNLPKMICSQCTKKLENIHRFASMALKTQENLKSLIEPKPVIIEQVKTENSILHSILSKGLDPDLEITEVEVKVDPMLFLCAFEEESNDDDKSDISSSPHAMHSTEKFSESELDEEDEFEEEEDCLESSQNSSFVGPSPQLLTSSLPSLSLKTSNHVTISSHQHQQANNTNTPPQSPEQKNNSSFEEDKEEESSKEHQDKSFSCSVCSKKFSNEIHLQNHLWIHLPRAKSLLNLSDINQQDSEDSSFAARSLLQSNSPPALHFVCPICGKKISTKGNLKVHLETHRPKGKYACDICGRVFKTQSNLVRHKDYHGGIQFPCGVCGRVYPTNSTLRAHSITHSDLRPHACPLCDKTFKRNQDLKFHINQHTGARPYQCPYCPKAFASSGNCFSHRKRMHPQEVERDREMASQIAR